MKIYIDADACPVVSIAEKVAAKFQIPVTLLCDTNHILQSDYSDVIVVDAGADAVDYKLISLCTKDDVVITQDYGVAAMALGKGAAAEMQPDPLIDHRCPLPCRRTAGSAAAAAACGR